MSGGSLSRGARGGPGLRAADADREWAWTWRSSPSASKMAYAARTTDELRALVRDLPTPPARRDRIPADPRVGAEDAAHAVRYLAVMALLVAVWALTGAGYFWPVWPMLGWGIGLLSHSGRGRGGPLPGSRWVRSEPGDAEQRLTVALWPRTVSWGNLRNFHGHNGS